jgi:tetratricopeptide (TPR) repeat protein
LRRRVDHPRLIALQANALEMLGRSEQAAPLYAEACHALGEHDPAFLNAYVRHLLKAGRWTDAVQRAEQALHIEPDNQEALAYLSTAWRLLGDPREFWLCDYERLIALVPVDVPAGYPDLASYLGALARSLNGLHQAAREPVRQSLRHGSQTPGRLFGRADPVIAAARDVLVRAVERWIAALPTDASHPFLRRAQRSVNPTGSWSVKLHRSGSHVNHYHSEGWMSSAYYVALPSSVRAASDAGSTAGHIQFGQPPVELDLGLAPRRTIRPLEGHLALFPSYLWHGTVPFDDPEPRITIAFDMLPRA